MSLVAMVMSVSMTASLHSSWCPLCEKEVAKQGSWRDIPITPFSSMVLKYHWIHWRVRPAGRGGVEREKRKEKLNRKERN